MTESPLAAEERGACIPAASNLESSKWRMHISEQRIEINTADLESTDPPDPIGYNLSSTKASGTRSTF